MQIEDIENTVAEIDQRFRLQAVGVDMWQAEYLVQRLQRRNVPVESIAFVPQVLMSMCSAMLEAFAEHNIELSPDKQLIADLHSLKVSERSYGVRLESPRGPSGHGDSATALAICLSLARNAKIHLAAIDPAAKLIVH